MPLAWDIEGFDVVPLVYQMGDDCVPNFMGAVIIKRHFAVRADHNSNMSLSIVCHSALLSSCRRRKAT